MDPIKTTGPPAHIAYCGESGFFPLTLEMREYNAGQLVSFSIDLGHKQLSSGQNLVQLALSWAVLAKST